MTKASEMDEREAIARVLCENRTWPGAWARANEVEREAWLSDADVVIALRLAQPSPTPRVEGDIERLDYLERHLGEWDYCDGAEVIEIARRYIAALAQPTPTPRVEEPAVIEGARRWIAANPGKSELAHSDHTLIAIYEAGVANGLAALTSPTPRGEEAIDAMCKAYAEETGYYIEFHRGLSSPSADKMRAGMRAALAALTSPTVDSSVAPSLRESLTPRLLEALAEVERHNRRGTTYWWCRKSMEQLAALGLVETWRPPSLIGRNYKHFPYRITDAGRQVLASEIARKDGSSQQESAGISND